MRLIIGLGNPGADYALNRHNIGFMAVDTLAARDGARWQKKFKGEIAVIKIAGEECLLVKPMTYMNLSGESVGEALRFYKLAPPDVIVLHDELDLSAGKVKVKQGGGHAGHNGLKSIDAHIGQDYWRVRLGIGRPESNGDHEQVSNYVLANFAKSDRVWLGNLITVIADAMPLMVKGDAAAFTKQVSTL